MIATEAGVELEAFECNRASGTYRTRYDTESMSASMGVVATLSKVEGSCPTELKPLGESVDTDALNEFFRDADIAGEHVSVTFPAGGYTVTVYGSGWITVTSSAESQTRGPTVTGDED